MDWDTFIKVWAVLGPLLAAAASAVWARRIQLKDREHEHSRELERLERADTAKQVDYARSVQHERHNELKQSLADFMASSHEYVRKQSEYWTDPVPEKHKAASLANDKFINSCQIVTLLGDAELAESATTLWNATIALPKSYNTPIDKAYEEKLAVCRAARASFNEQARAYLRYLDEKQV
jgi:hypothetical protein